MDKEKKMLLVVDDSEIIVKRVIELLSTIDQIDGVLSAGTFKEGLDRMEEYHPFAVLLDINLPDKSGIELLRIINEKFPHTVPLMLTNQSDDYYRNLCKRLGAAYFLDKSRDFEMIPSIISSISSSS